MKVKSFAPLLAACALLASGCATEGIPASQAKPVPVARTFENPYSKPIEGYGKIIVTRDIGNLGGATYIRIIADDEKIADLETGEKVEFFMSEGKHTLVACVGLQYSTCTGHFDSYEMNVKTHKDNIYRVGFGAKNGMRLALGIWPDGF
jgi:hypothetical protein